MKKVLAFVFMLTTVLAFGQEGDWKTEVSKDGKVTVKSHIEDTESGKHIFYISQTTTNQVSLDQLEAFMRNSSNHKDFLENTEESKEVKKVDENSWIMYLYFDAPWPMPNSDAVQKFTVNRTASTLTITGKSSINDYKKTDVDRMSTNNISYQFVQKADKTIEITVTSDFEPIGSVPEFLLKSWFPKGPANIVKRLISGASKL